MSDRVFIDTNVFVYADDAGAGPKQARARAVIAPLLLARRAVVSTQVMQEYFNTAVRKLNMPPERARWRVEALARLEVVVIRPELILAAIDLHRLNGVSLWDALVIKCASVAGCSKVITEDLNNGQTIDGVRVENPFAQPSRSEEPRGRYQIQATKAGPPKARRTARKARPAR